MRSLGRQGRLIAAAIDALVPIVGIVLLGWSAVAYVIWFLADCVLVPAGAVARRVQFQMQGFDPGADATWVDRASLHLAPVLSLSLFAVVMGLGVAGFLTPAVLFAGWWPEIVATWHSELLIAIACSVVLQTLATLRPARPLTSIEVALREERNSALPLALALAVLPGAIEASAWLGTVGLLAVAGIASGLRVLLAWIEENA